MALRYDVDILGDEKLVDEIEALRERGSDLKPAFWAVLRKVIVPLAILYWLFRSESNDPPAA